MKTILKRSTRFQWALPLALLLAFGTISCSTHVGNPSDDEAAETTKKGTENPILSESVSFSFAKTTFEDAASVLVYVDEIALRKKTEGEEDTDDESEENDESNWIKIPLVNENPINLLDPLASESIEFANSDAIPAGNYSEMRLILNADKAVTLTLENGDSFDIKAPSSDTGGVKIKGDIVVDETNSSFVIDFDLTRSLIKEGGNGNSDRNVSYKLQPVIRLADKDESGTLEGTSTASLVCVYEDIEDADLTADCPEAIATTKVKNGSYKLNFLKNGTYDLRLFNEDGSYTDLLDIVVEKRIEEDDDENETD